MVWLLRKMAWSQGEELVKPNRLCSKLFDAIEWEWGYEVWGRNKNSDWDKLGDEIGWKWEDIHSTENKLIDVAPKVQ